MKRTIILTMALVAVGAQAVIYSTNWSSGFVNGTTIPDGSFSGWTDTRAVSTLPAGTVQGIAVDLEMASGWAGDLYAYLVKMDIVAVPEVEAWIAAALAGAFGAFWVNRQVFGRKVNRV
jgi:hypothetical protein